MKHSNISPSQAERFFGCPGSVQAIAKIALDLPPSQVALEGTAIHELAAQCLRNNLKPDDMLGETIEIEPTPGDTMEFKVDDEFVYVAKVYVDTIDELLQKHGLTRKALQVEAKYTLPEVDKDARGTTDCSFLAGDTLYVIDLKSGRGIVVDAEENKQGMYYAVRPFLDAKFLIRKIVIMIIQPRAKEGAIIKAWETTPERMNAFVTELKEAITLTRAKNAPIVPGDWCTFCPAAGSCQGIQKAMLTQAQTVLPNVMKLIPCVTELTAEKIGNALPALTMLKEVLGCLEDYALALALKGQEIPNYCLVRGKKNRQWIDEQAVIDELGEEYGPRIMSLKSPAQVEKVVGKDKVKDLVVIPEGELKLTLKKEVQNEIKQTVEDVFKNVQLN